MERKNWWELHKDSAFGIQPVLEAETHKTAAVKPCYLQSHKPSKLDEPDMLGTAGEVRTNLWVTFVYGLKHMNTPEWADPQKLT